MIWALLIFGLSRDPHSGRHISKILQWAFALVGIHHVRHFHTWTLLAAKGAHFSVYFVLSLAVYRALALGRGAAFHARQAWWTVLIIFCYASSDEFHQTFVHGRNGDWRDVVLDTFGGIIALLIVRWVVNARRRRQQALRPEQVSA